MGNRFDRNFGSGYPSDPITKKWLLGNVDYVFGFPSIVRFSWKTCSQLLSGKGATVEW
jgi:ribonuclease H2 subunit A